jgi:uncharacterized membrane protein YdjX (TVP38/TMEM64 family)
MTLPSRSTCKLLLKGGALFISLAGIILFAQLFDLSSFDARWVDAHIRNRGAAGIFLFITITALFSALGFPRQALSFLGGYAFGAEWGVLWATLGTTAGCALGFGYARVLGRSFCMRFFERRMRKLNAFLARSPFTMTLVIRCLPVGSNAITSLLGGLSAIPPLSFIAGSFVGYIPQNLIFAILGSGMRVEPFWRIVLSAVLFTLSSALGYMLYRRHRVAQTLEEDNDTESH